MDKQSILIFIIIALIIIFASSLMIPGSEKHSEKYATGVFTEWYNVNRYHIAGTDNFQYVIDFVFETEEEATAFIQKIEQLRITGEGYDSNKRDDRADKNEG